jgi:hypothetical protein
MPRFRDERPDTFDPINVNVAQGSINVASPLDERIDLLRRLLDEADAALAVLEAKLQPVLASPVEPGLARPEASVEPRSELAAFFTYSTSRVRDLNERIAYVVERVDL